MTVKLLTEHHFEFLRLKGGCRGSSESTLVKMPHFGNHMSRLTYPSLPESASTCMIYYLPVSMIYYLPVSMNNGIVLLLCTSLN